MLNICQPLLYYYSEQMDNILALSVIGAYILIGRLWDNIITNIFVYVFVSFCLFRLICNYVAVTWLLETICNTN